MGDGYSHPTMARTLGDSLVQSPGWLMQFWFLILLPLSRAPEVFLGVWDCSEQPLRWVSACKALRPLRSLLLCTSNSHGG